MPVNLNVSMPCTVLWYLTLDDSSVFTSEVCVDAMSVFSRWCALGGIDICWCGVGTELPGTC